MIYVNHELKALYFHIPKCGGTNIKRLLIQKYGFISIKEKNVKNKRSDHINEFAGNNTLLDDPNLSVTSIRKKGVLRYFIDNKVTNEDLNMDDIKWDTYFKFTFVRNPYKKFLSAVNYLKLTHKSVPPENHQYCYKNFRSFFDFKNFIHNFGYFHSYITQNDHLLNYNSQINVNFLGDIDNYDNDMKKIFEIIGLENCEVNNIDESNLSIIHNKNIDYDNKKFYEIYEQETLSLVNNDMSIDFDLLGFKKFDNYDDFTSYYSNEVIENIESYIEPILCSKCNNFKAYNKRALDAHCYHCK